MTPAASSIVDWSAIDTVFVDMDGTLLDLNFDTFFWREVVPQRYALLHGLMRMAIASGEARDLAQHVERQDGKHDQHARIFARAL